MKPLGPKLFFLLFLAFGFALSQPIQAKIQDLRPKGPLRVRTQNPLYLQILALPMESPQTLNRDQFESSMETTFSNVFEFDNISTTRINMDMELYRTAFQFTYGLSDKLDVKIELPFISTTGGFLDNFIEGYHDLFGFPESGRKLVPRKEHHFTVTRNGQQIADYDAVTAGLSDINIRFKYLLSDHFNLPFKLAIAPYLKVPTGSTSKGLSSGHFDFGVSTLVQFDVNRFHLTTHLGVVILGRHAKLDVIMGDVFFSFGQSLRFQLWNHFSLVAQLNGNTSAFKNVDTRDLRRIALDLNIGVAGTIPIKNSAVDEFFYQWSFSEDILSSGPSVDFSLLFKAGIRY